jgi:hypothetical protein
MALGLRMILQGYGFARLVLGVAELVALFSAYFFLEVILRYPSQITRYVLSEDMIALVYLAMLFRSLFHIVVGIGLTRVQSWVRVWLYIGWMMMALIAFGLAQTMFHDWQEAGYVSSFSSVFSSTGVVLFLLWTALDVFLIAPRINTWSEKPGFCVTHQQLVWVAIAAGLFFTFLLFFGRPIKQGFHRGFYKVRAADVRMGKTISAPTMVPENKADTAASATTAPGTPSDQIERMQTGPAEQSRIAAKVIPPASGGNRTAESRGLPYDDLIGVFGALFLIAGFGLQIYRVWKDRNADGMSWSGIGCLVGGFAFLFVYGLAQRLGIVAFTGAGCSFLSGILLLVKIRVESVG